jgi:hypothetical protein
MTVSAGSAQNYKRARITLKDTQGQKVGISFYLVNASAESDATLLISFTAFLNHLEAISSATVAEAFLENVSEIPFTSDKTAETAQYATIDQDMVLDFQRSNPLKPSGILSKNFPIPAYKVGVASLDFPAAGVPNVSNTDVAAIISFMNARLATRYSGDGLIYNGFTFVAGNSLGLSVSDIVDNA